MDLTIHNAQNEALSNRSVTQPGRVFCDFMGEGGADCNQWLTEADSAGA